MFWIFALFTYALLRWVMHGFEMKMPGEDEDWSQNPKIHSLWPHSIKKLIQSNSDYYYFSFWNNMKEAFEYVWNFEPNTQSMITWIFWLAVIIINAVYHNYKHKKSWPPCFVWKPYSLISVCRWPYSWYAKSHCILLSCSIDGPLTPMTSSTCTTATTLKKIKTQFT